jgi:hypothetical protein
MNKNDDYSANKTTNVKDWNFVFIHNSIQVTALPFALKTMTPYVSATPQTL